MKKLSKILFSRVFMVTLVIFLQLYWILQLMYQVSARFSYANLLIKIISVLLVLYITTTRSNPSMKLAWTFLILFLPVVGIVLYVVFGRTGLTKRTREQMDAVNQRIEPFLKKREDYIRELEDMDLEAAKQSEYISTWAHFPLYKNTSARYYESGEAMFPDMLKALEEAEHYIFLEFFILAKGEMFDAVTNILKRKAKEGVDVRIIYDDLGCALTQPHHFYRSLQQEGIKCAAFNVIRPILSIIMNNRDHRKIVVIDGKTAFTGGINIADEYINKKSRFGYWKDTGIRLEGDAVFSFTVMFLEMWDYINHITEENYENFRPQVYQKTPFVTDGFVQPYGDTPLDDETVGKNVYMNIINRARKYVYIFTPYLIIDYEMFIALCNAVKSGVDIRIVTPGIPDKKMIFLLTQSYYQGLLENGIKIYQFSPGFLHAKCFVSDDNIATVGSINMDYRSLYLHFECGVFLYKSKAVEQVKEDLLKTMEQSEQITLEFCKNRSIFIRILQSILNLFSPLL